MWRKSAHLLLLLVNIMLLNFCLLIVCPVPVCPQPGRSDCEPALTAPNSSVPLFVCLPLDCFIFFGFGHVFMFLCALYVAPKVVPRSRLRLALERKVRRMAAMPGGQASAQGRERSHTTPHCSHGGLCLVWASNAALLSLWSAAAFLLY